MGDFLRAREQLEEVISLYDRERHAALTFRFGVDAGINSLSYLGQTLLFLGYPDQGFNRSYEALSLARAMSNAHSLAFAQNFVSSIHLYRRESDAAQKVAQDLIALSLEQGTRMWLAHANAVRGFAIAAQGHQQDGIAQVQQALAAYRATRTELGMPEFLCLLGEACMHADRVDDGLAALNEAQRTADRQREHNWDAEINRVRGELLLRRGNSNVAEAMISFEKAIEMARRQSGKLLELRATASQARLLAKQNRLHEASTMLADIYNWFTEGFDTADLKDAKALLDDLSV
jgi:predicted ATPase